jgi:hypothetical protein
MASSGMVVGNPVRHVARRSSENTAQLIVSGSYIDLQCVYALGQFQSVLGRWEEVSLLTHKRVGCAVLCKGARLDMV